MRVPFFQRLPVRLAGALLLVGLLVLPVVTGLERREVEKLVLQQAELQAATATIAVVDGLEDVLRSVETNTRYVARDLENRPLNPSEVNRIIHNALVGNPKLSEFSISFEPGALDPGTNRFGQYINRVGGHLVERDLASTDYQYWTRDWYTDTVARRDQQWSEPFFDKGGANANVVRFTVPFFATKGGQRVVAGVVAAGLELGWVRQLTEENQFFDSGYVIIFSRSGRLLTHPDPKVVFLETMESLAQKTGNPELLDIYQRVAANRQGAFSYQSNGLHKRVHENFKPVQLAGWGVVVGFYESEFLSQLSAYRWITTLSLAVTLLLLASVVILAIRLALRPLSMLTDVSLEISRGNLDLEIETPRRKDEIGHLQKAFIVMREALRKNRELEAKVRERSEELAAANKRLTSEVIERRWVNLSLEHQLRYDRLIINSINDMVVVCTKALNISRVNPAVIHKTGFQPAELVDSPLSRIVKLDSESGGQGGVLVNALLQSLKDGRDMRNEPAVIVDRTGKTTRVTLALFPIRDKDVVVGGVAVLQVVPSKAASD